MVDSGVMAFAAPKRLKSMTTPESNMSLIFKRRETRD